MKKLIFVIVIFSLILTGCARVIMSEHLQAGKISFTSGNYQLAFHQLLPLAASGDREAQYAVGYMYYYGMGVPEDCESGLFWMHRSADQHYGPAVYALRTIEGVN